MKWTSLRKLSDGKIIYFVALHFLATIFIAKDILEEKMMSEHPRDGKH